MSAVPTARVAIACCRNVSGGDPDDLYPDFDAPPIRAALQDRGVDSTLLSWDDARVDWASFSHILISSTWDSVDRPREYLEWIRHVTDRAILVNPAAVIEWGLDKRHQRQLSAAGVPVIPTTWVTSGDPWNPPDFEFVVKPAVSAGGRETARYQPGDPAAIAHVRSLNAAGQTAMVQPYLASIDRDGEVNTIFVSGVFSHAVVKRPVLTAGEGVVDRPWERMSWDGVITPTATTLAVARRAVDRVTELAGAAPVYARVDFVNDLEGQPVVLEVEVVDPNLSFDMVPGAAHTLAAAVLEL